MTLNSTIVINGSSDSGAGTLTSADPNSKSISVETDRILMVYEDITFMKDMCMTLLHWDFIMKLPTHESASPGLRATCTAPTNSIPFRSLYSQPAVSVVSQTVA
jgi:hypothetical protein